MKLQEINLTPKQYDELLKYLELIAPGSTDSLSDEVRVGITSRFVLWLQRLWQNLLASRPWFPKMGRLG
jgi:hypothetical protein